MLWLRAFGSGFRQPGQPLLLPNTTSHDKLVHDVSDVQGPHHDRSQHVIGASAVDIVAHARFTQVNRNSLTSPSLSKVSRESGVAQFNGTDWSTTTTETDRVSSLTAEEAHQTRPSKAVKNFSRPSYSSAEKKLIRIPDPSTFPIIEGLRRGLYRRDKGGLA